MAQQTRSPKISEIMEFAGFAPCEQRYIRRSLCVAFGENNPVLQWARNPDEEYSIQSQELLYMQLESVRELVKEPYALRMVPIVMPNLMSITAFDLSQGSLRSFVAYRFLYERMLGARARQWLPSAFCGAGALPHLKPERRKVLLQSISENAATALCWPEREPFFFPSWVDK